MSRASPWGQMNSVVGLAAGFLSAGYSGSLNTKSGGALYDAAFQKHLQAQLEAIEKIRPSLEQESISVPGIVVCGAQSSGKSSLLEAITGINFPRAESTCTRCPAIVQLARSDGCQPHAFVGRDPSFSKATRVEDLSDIAACISDLTTQIAGEGKQQFRCLCFPAPEQCVSVVYF